MATLNEKYGVVDHWELRLRYYRGMGTYLEAKGVRGIWVVCSPGRVSLGDVVEDVMESLEEV